MKYFYAYKDSDGVRHEAALEAESREAAFAALRARGIKAIKVVAADGSKANGEVVLRGVRKRMVAAIAGLTALVAAALSYCLMSPESSKDAPANGQIKVVFSSPESQDAYTNLVAKANSILRAHAETIAKLGLDILVNYALIEHTQEPAIFFDKVRQGYRAVDASRTATREAFKSIYVLFSADCAEERAAAQKLYAQTMDVLDLSEGKIANDEKALKLLIANRGKWHCEQGQVIWTDGALANEFEYFRREVPLSISRRPSGKTP